MTDYVHGYGARERARLEDQARTLEALLHAGTAYRAGSRVLEAGCGTGAQTVALARRSPGALITAVDRSAASLEAARARVAAAGLGNVAFRCADLMALPFPRASFDHVFVCFVLEHVAEPAALLAALARVLRPGGTLTAIEGDHGSTLFHPDSAAAHAAIGCQVALQRRAGGDAMIGRRLFPLLTAAGCREVVVEPRVVYADASRPALVDGFVRRTFIAMIEGVRAPALATGLIAAERFDAGIRDLGRTAEADGVFCYTFFKATGFAGGGLSDQRR
jgi:SAM-dependent methyltransferase